MPYSIKEIFYTLQGEGVQAGRPAVFLRFAGCNFWNGKDEDRATARCNFCDTDFIGTNGPGGGTFSRPEDVCEAIRAKWPSNAAPFVVCTGGEPLLQLDAALVRCAKAAGFELALETNGSLPAPEGIDWIAVSPKSMEHFVQRSGNELKVVFPAAFALDQLERLPFSHFLLSPKWVPDASLRERHLREAIDYCKGHPRWRLSVQQHKIWNIP